MTPHLISPFPSLREDSVTLSPHFLLHFPELLQARGKIRVLPLLQPARLHIQERSLRRKKATVMSSLCRGWANRILEPMSPPTPPLLEEHHLLLTVALFLAWIKDSKGRTPFQRLATISSPALSAKHPPSGKRRLVFGVLREAIAKGRKFLPVREEYGSCEDGQCECATQGRLALAGYTGAPPRWVKEGLKLLQGNSPWRSNTR